MVDVRRLFAWLAALGFFGAAIGSHAQGPTNGYIDTSFTNPCLGSLSANFIPRALHVIPDGRIFVGGHFATPLACANGLARLRTNGGTDTTFTSPLGPTDFVTCFGVQSSGKVIIGGQLSQAGSLFPISRIGANGPGTLDPTFNHFTGQPLVANALAVQPDDKIVVVGAFANSSGFISRFNVNGGLDSSFTNTVATDPSPNGIALRAVALQGPKILVGGLFRTYSDGSVTTNRHGLVRLNSNGELDLLFRPPVNNADVRALLLQPDGKILVAGLFELDGFADRCIARLNSDGTRDDTFSSLNGLGITGLGLALQPDGKILLSHTHGIMRLTTNGAVDATFGPLNAPGNFGTAATTAAAVARTLDGNVLVGATVVVVGSTQRRGVARLWATVPPRPGIVQQPATQTVESGTNITFSVIATGAPPLTYQWFKEGNKIKNATNSTFTINGVNSTHAGNYRVEVSNPGGTTSSIVARLTVNFHTSPLIIITNGAGVVLPDLTKNELEIGRSFTVTARPAAGNLFSNWLGGVTSSTPVLTFVMQSNLVLIVNFVPSPFIAAKGVYNGLFFDTNSPAHNTAGAVTVALDDKGGIRGSVRRGTKTRKFKGTFSVERTATVTLPATATDSALTLSLEIDVVNAVINGSVSFSTNFSTNVATLVAYRNPFSSTLNPAPNSGRYNAALPGMDDAVAAPPGDGFLPLTVSTAGRVSAKGTLADGSPVKVTSATSATAMTPVYSALYSGRGSIFGWLSISNNGVNDVSGTLWWIKPGTVGGALYPAGFTNEIDVLGSVYTPVAGGTPVLNLTDDLVVISHGNLQEPFTNSVTLGGDNKITGDNQLTLTISPSKGTVTGSFVDPSSSRKRVMKGVALPLQNQARGFFLGSSQGGRLFVGDAP
jgi:uncharacterized delta-60 repeat protein